MHSAADYGSWFSPQMRSSFCSRIAFSPQTNHSRVRLKDYRDHLFKEVSIRLFGTHLSAIAAFSPAQMNRAKRENEL